MELQELLESIFHTKQFTLEKTKKGYTNKNYLLHVNNTKYIVRVPWEHSEHVVNHKHEEKTLQAIHHLHFDVPCIYYNAQSGIKITQYIEGLEEYQECHDPNKIIRVAHMMRRLHRANLSIHDDFQPLHRLRQYQKHVHHPLYNLSEFNSILTIITQFQNPHVLCHNDWVSGNILFSDTRDYLIDYEYSADNDPLFDVMSFLTENNINDNQERERFYHAYFDELSDETRNHLSIWESFHNMLWCTWAMMMWEQRQEAIYKEIAEMKYQALCNSFLRIK